MAPIDEDVAKLSLGSDAPPPPPAAGGFSFAAPPGGGAPAGGFSFNLAPPAPPGGSGSGDGEDDDDEEEEEEDDTPPLPKEVLQRVLGLKALEEKRSEEMKAYMVERAALEKKYAAAVAPILADRSKIVRGELEPELSAEDKATVEQAGTTTDEGEGGPIVGVPEFWLSALGRNGAFEHFLEPPDVEALKFLVDVRCTDNDDLTGFTLEFEFRENPFFSDAVLTKSYVIPNLVDANGQPELEDIQGCEIAWKDPKDNLCRHEIKKKQKSKRGKNAGQTRVVTKLEDKPSFFHFFATIKLPKGDDDDDEGDDEDFDEALRDKIDNDVELAFALRNQIVPHAVLWFTGEACDDDDEDYDYDDEDDDDDDDEEED